MIDLYNKLEKLKDKEDGYFQAGIFEQALITDNQLFKYEENITDNGNSFKVEYKIKTKYECIIIYKIEKKKFNHLKNNSSADVVFISKYNNKYKLDILEIKSSMTDDELDNLSKQLIGGYLRVIFLLSPLHLNISSINLHVAFYDDKNITIKNTTVNSDAKKKSRMYNIQYWKNNKIYLEKTMPNKFFDKNEIHINKIKYKAYNKNNKSAIIDL